MEELNKFIKDITDDLNKKYQKSTEKLLMQDIIMIYNRCYCNYNHYRNNIIEGNKRIDETESIGISFAIHPKHIILDEEIYNFILSLKSIYK